MREILFRGKDVKEHWHTGLLAHVGNAWYISNGAGIPTAHEVIPSTIGQYTGLTDKYGEKIFEDDIVKIKGKIRYIFYGSSGFCHTNYNEYSDALRNVFTVVDCEVIGNTIDNPELLKERE